MSYYTMPPLAANFGLNLNAAAGAAGITASALLAAPGAGLAYRIVGFHLGFLPTGVGPVNWQLRAVLDSGGAAYSDLSMTWYTCDATADIPAPGILVPVNTAILVTTWCSLGAAAFLPGLAVVLVRYFVDPVT